MAKFGVFVLSAFLVCVAVPAFAQVSATTGDSPVTVTVSCRLATFMSEFTVAVNPRPTRMPSRTTVPKPVSS